MIELRFLKADDPNFLSSAVLQFRQAALQVDASGAFCGLGDFGEWRNVPVECAPQLPATASVLTNNRRFVNVAREKWDSRKTAAIKPMPSYGAIELGTRSGFASVAVVSIGGGGDMFLCQESFVPFESKNLISKKWLGSSLQETTGDCTDLSAIGRSVEAFTNRGVRSWLFDPAVAAMFAGELQDKHRIACVAFSKTYRNFHEPLLQFRELIEAGRVYHDGDPLLADSILSLRLKENSGGQLMPDCCAEGIPAEPAIAAIMAFANAMGKA